MLTSFIATINEHYLDPPKYLNYININKNILRRMSSLKMHCLLANTLYNYLINLLSFIRI